MAFAILVIFAVGAGRGSAAEQKLQVLQSHVRPAVLQGKAKMTGAMPPEAQLHISFLLPLRDQAGLDQLLARLYDPSSPDYRHFLSVAEFTERFGPTQEDYAAVVAFARSNGLEVTGRPENRMVVPLSGSVASINKTLHVQMAVYQHPVEKRTFFSPDREPSLALDVPVRHISGLNNYSLPKPMVQRRQEGQAAVPAILPGTTTGSGPNGSFLASDMRAAYYGGTKLTGAGQAVGLLEFGGYYQSDVDATFSQAGQSYSVPIVDVLLDGAQPYPQGDEAEQVLDIVQAIGMAPGLSQVRVYVGNTQYGLDDANLLNAMASENLAKSLSCSWSWRPEDPQALDVFFEEMAAQGQSFFAASGDYGAFDTDYEPYFFPQEDAYVTAVGGTHLTTTGPGGEWSAETSWNNPPYGSGGGVSPNGVPIASWQSGVATAANGGSTMLRNVPDVAMEADFDNFICIYGSHCYADYAGTSFAAPRWAGFMALVDQQAVQAGNAPQGGVGFVNPAIYAIGASSRYSSDFHDTVTGNNQTLQQPVWYPAEPLYDLVTGWGSPSGQALIDDLAGKPVSEFSIAASSAGLAMNPGASASTTIQVSCSAGFSGTVSLAITSALPSGVTAKWSKSPTTDSSTLTVTAASSVANLTIPLTITGTSGSLVQTTQISLTVHTPSFSVGAYPSSAWMPIGGSTQTNVFVTPLYGFTKNVQLAVSGLPTGITAAFGTNPTSSESLLMLKASGTAIAGDSKLTVTGTSGTLKATYTLPLHVATPTFEIVTVKNFSMGPGTTNSVWVDVFNEYGFTAPVKFSVSGLPSGVTGAIVLDPKTNYGTLTLTATTEAALGTSTVTVAGTSGTQQKTAAFQLNLVPPAITLSTTGGLDMVRGGSVTQTVYLTSLYGFNGSVKLAVTGIPTGVTATLVPSQTTSLSLLTLTASSIAALGRGTVTVTGNAGSLTASTSFPLGIYTPSFSLSTTGTASVGIGTSTSTQVYVKPNNGFLGSVNLGVSGLPAGVTASFSTNPTTATTVLTLTASASATAGQSTLTITGVSGQIVQKVPLVLRVVNPGFKIGGPPSMTVGVGNTATGAVTVTPQNGFTASVALSVSGLPVGVTAAVQPNPTTGVTATKVNLVADSSAVPGQYSVTLTGTAGTETETASFPLTVAAPNFKLTNSGTIMLGQGSSATSTITVAPANGFNGSVQLSVAALPHGITASLLPGLTTGTSTLTLNATSAVAPATYNILVNGASGTLRATTVIPVKVAAPGFTLAPVSDTTVLVGTTATVPVTVNPAYGFTGSVAFSVQGLPAGVHGVFSPNPSSTGGTLTLTVAETAAVGAQVVTVSGTSGTLSATCSFTLNVQTPNLQLFPLGTVQVGVGGSIAANVGAYGDWSSLGGVTYGVLGLPSGVAATFSPNPANTQSVMTLSAASNIAPGSWPLTLAGTVGKATGTTSFVLRIGTPSFIASGPKMLMLSQGGKITGDFYSLSQFGFSGAVQFSISGLPSGVTGSWAPMPGSSSDEILTLTASPTATIVGTTAIVTATSGALKMSLPLQLVVVPPMFSLSTYGGVNLTRGQSASTTVLLNSSTGYSGSVSLAVTGLPSGVTASFAPPTTSSNSVLTLSASSTAAFGAYNLTVTGTSGQVSATTIVSVTVVSDQTPFQVTGWGQVQVDEGSSATSYVSVIPINGFTGSVKLSAAGLPQGVTASFLPNPTTENSTMTLSAANSSTLGEYTASVVGTYLKQTASFPIDVTVSQPTFSLSGYLNQPFGPGSSAQGSVYVRSQPGFTGSVQLSVTGLPAGVTASFALNPVVNQTQITLTAASNTKPGRYNVTLHGVLGSQSATAIMAVEIAAPSFSIYANDFTLGPSSSSSGYVGIDWNNSLTGAVQLSVAGLPGGVTASFASNPTSANTTLTLTASATASVGQYTVVLTGKSGTQTVTTQFGVTVLPASFSVYGPGSLDLGIGATLPANFYVQANNGVAPNTRFSVSGLPGGVSGVFSPNPTTYSTSLALTATSAATPGHYTLTVTGTSGAQSSSTSFTLNVGHPGFTITNFGVGDLGQGESATTQVFVNNTFGFSSAVQFSLTGLPAGVTGTFSPASSTYYSTLTLNASAATKPGTYQPAIVGTAGSLKASSPFTLTIGTPGFALNEVGTISVGQGSTANTYLYFQSQFGFSAKVSFSASGLPAGVTASFSPNPTTFSTTMTLSASSSATPGQYAGTVMGTYGSLHVSVPMTVVVIRPVLRLIEGGFTTVNRGGYNSTSVRIDTSQGFIGSVQLAASSLPSGVTASFSPNPTTSTSNVTLTASSTAALGQYDYLVTGTSGGQTATTAQQVRVVDPSFTVSGFNDISVGQGSSTTAYFYLNSQNGFSGQVQFAVTGLPSGVTASFSPNPTTNSTVMTLNAASTATLGQYNITVTGTSGKLSSSAIFPVAIYAPAFSLGTEPNLVIGQGASTNTYISVSPQYGFKGNVQLSVTGLPKGVTGAFSPNPTTGGSMLTLTATSTASLGMYNVVIMGTSGQQKASTAFQLGVYTPTFTLGPLDNVAIGRGKGLVAYVPVNPLYGFTGTVQLTVSGLPNGVTGILSVDPNYGNILTLKAATNATVGQFTITVTGTSGSQQSTATFQLGVYVPTFTLTSYSGIQMSVGQTAYSNVFVSDQYGFTGNVTLSATGLPAGVTAAFSPNPASYYSSVALTAGSTVTAGSYTITVHGASGSQTAQVTIPLTIQ